jgi:hypothetical protein
VKVALVSCTKHKNNYTCTAKEMYKESTLFKKAVKYIEQQDYDNWYVLSAKYGLIKQSDEIEPYDITLNNMKVSDRKNWSDLVLKQLKNLECDLKQIDFYSGIKYREYLLPVLEDRGINCNVPLKGKGIGEQLQFYLFNTR